MVGLLRGGVGGIDSPVWRSFRLLFHQCHPDHPRRLIFLLTAAGHVDDVSPSLHSTMARGALPHPAHVKLQSSGGTFHSMLAGTTSDTETELHKEAVLPCPVGIPRSSYVKRADGRDLKSTVLLRLVDFKLLGPTLRSRKQM